MDLRYFSFLRVLDYPFQPHMWFRNGRRDYKWMTGKEFKEFYNEAESLLLSGNYKQPSNSKSLSKYHLKKLSRLIEKHEKNPNRVRNWIRDLRLITV